jgi:hypothetical protein
VPPLGSQRRSRDACAGAPVGSQLGRTRTISRACRGEPWVVVRIGSGRRSFNRPPIGDRREPDRDALLSGGWLGNRRLHLLVRDVQTAPAQPLVFHAPPLDEPR